MVASFLQRCEIEPFTRTIRAGATGYLLKDVAADEVCGFEALLRWIHPKHGMISPVIFAVGNLLLRRASGVPMFDLFAWLCLIPPLPLLALTLAIDGPRATWHSLAQMSPTGVGSMIFIGAISTCVA